MKIKWINYGIASRQGNLIFINKNLQNYPELCYSILEHEKEHSSSFKLKDIKLDIQNKHLKGKKKEYYSFILSNPSSWVEFSPFWVYEGHLVVNPLILGLYIVFIAILGVVL